MHLNRINWRLLARLTIWIIGISLFAMILGPWVRAEDAGLACPDWPLCHGRVIPHNYGTFLEVFHRYVVGLVLGPLFIIWFFMIQFHPARRLELRMAAWLAGLLLVLQVYLGMATITQKLDEFIVSSHLLNAILFLSVLIWIWRQLYQLAISDKPPAPHPSHQKNTGQSVNPMNWHIWVVRLMLVLVFLQLFLGSRVSSQYAHLACPEFPACYTEHIESENEVVQNTVYLPPMVGKIEVHMSHRFMAYILAGLTLGLWALAYKSGWANDLLRLVNLFTSLIFIQMVLGVLNVIWQVPVLITVMHSTVAYLIYITIFIMPLEMKYRAKQSTV